MAAFVGNTNALKVLVGRGGDPDMADNYGNTALHLASSKGHLNCVNFLIKFGVNQWAMDIDRHTAKELASMNDRIDVLQYLDAEASRQGVEDPKKKKKQMDLAEKNLPKLIKAFEAAQKKADKLAKKNQKELANEEKNMAVDVSHRDSVAIATTSFSEMTGVSANGNKSNSGFSKIVGTVKKKTAVRKARIQDDTFKVRGVDNGEQNVKHLTGIRRGSEVMFGPAKMYDNPEDVDIDEASPSSSINRSITVPTAGGPRRESNFGLMGGRPGFGSLAFRPSMAIIDSMNTLNEVEGIDEEDEDSDGGGASPQVNSPIDMMLAGLGLSKYIKVFRKNSIDMDALMYLDDDLLKEMVPEVGPRIKIMNAIKERKKDMEEEN